MRSRVVDDGDDGDDEHSTTFTVSLVASFSGSDTCHFTSL